MQKYVFWTTMGAAASREKDRQMEEDLAAQVNPN